MPDDDARFAACLSQMLRHEGGYADNPRDPGGATNLGITIATLANWRGAPVSKTAVKELGPDEAGAIYRKLYWDRCRGGDLPAGLDLAVFDYAVNSGPTRAVKALQKELKVAADGYFGPLTLNALKARIGIDGAGALIVALCNGRLSFLQKLAAFAVFGRGWSRRVDDIRTTALAMAGAKPSNPRSKPMDVLAGYKTYIVAGIMVLAALAQMAGADLPSLDGHSAGQLLMEAFAIIFLRRGVESSKA